MLRRARDGEMVCLIAARLPRPGRHQQKAAPLPLTSIRLFARLHETDVTALAGLDWMGFGTDTCPDLKWLRGFSGMPCVQTKRAGMLSLPKPENDVLT